MKLSVACNFDDALLSGLAGYPVYELYGKLTSDFFGGGRPSFYLPEVGRRTLARYVDKTRRAGIAFNYLFNALAMGNREYTRAGQRHAEELLDWLDGIGVDSVTVANIFLLRLVKRRYPRLKVRVSSHMHTDNARKVRFWVDNGADYVVVSETNIHREFAVLRAMQEAAAGVELQLIVNNWCRQDCAIASNHAVTLNAASQEGSKGFPIDYCSLVCNELRVREPVNYLRANWIRPEDLARYEALGYHNFKIVERNTPTPILLARVRAYAARRYDGNLLDLVQNYAYPEEAYQGRAADAYSLRRMVKYFVKPRVANMLKFGKVVAFGKTASVLYPRRGPNPVQVDNRALDGFLAHFEAKSCLERDCEACRYCHEWAERTVRIDPAWRTRMRDDVDALVGELDSGGFWEPYAQTLRGLWRRLLGREAATASRPRAPDAWSPRAPQTNGRSVVRLPLVRAGDDACRGGAHPTLF